MITLFKQWLFIFLVTLLILTPLNRVASQTADDPPPAASATQEATPEPTATIDVTPESTVVIIPTAPSPAVDSGDSLNQLFDIAALIIGSIISGSLLTIGGVIVLVRTIRTDPEKMLLIERLFDSRPDEARARIRGGVDLAREFVSIADEATDGIPMGSKPPTTPTRPGGG